MGLRRVAAGARGGARIAMSLVELLVAMSILVIMSVSTAVLFRGVSKAWRSGQLRTERYQQARLLCDLFARELSSCVVSTQYPLFAFIGHDAGQGAALRAESTQDELFFVGMLPGRGGLVERGYWVNSRHQLMCHDEEPADGDYATGSDERCGSDVMQFDVTYFDGSAWVTQWDGRPGAAQAGLTPKAVHMTLQIGERDGEQFETVIYIPTG